MPLTLCSDFSLENKVHLGEHEKATEKPVLAGVTAPRAQNIGPTGDHGNRYNRIKLSLQRLSISIISAILIFRRLLHRCLHSFLQVEDFIYAIYKMTAIDTQKHIAA